MRIKKYILPICTLRAPVSHPYPMIAPLQYFKREQKILIKILNEPNHAFTVRRRPTSAYTQILMCKGTVSVYPMVTQKVLTMVIESMTLCGIEDVD